MKPAKQYLEQNRSRYQAIKTRQGKVRFFNRIAREVDSLWAIERGSFEYFEIIDAITGRKS